MRARKRSSKKLPRLTAYCLTVSSAVVTIVLVIQECQVVRVPETGEPQDLEVSKTSWVTSLVLLMCFAVREEGQYGLLFNVGRTFVTILILHLKKTPTVC